VEQTKIQMSQIGTALDMFYTDCGFYPASLEELTTAPSSCPNWGPDPYLKEVPRDKWNTPFVYEIEGSNYFLMSLGEDKREGGDGTAKDIRSDELGR
jgi:general secretion pathway protein G